MHGRMYLPYPSFRKKVYNLRSYEPPVFGTVAHAFGHLLHLFFDGRNPPSYRIMIEKPTFEAMPQIMARLEEKVDALTETVGKLLQGAMAPMVVTAPEEMV